VDKFQNGDIDIDKYLDSLGWIYTKNRLHICHS
jgi:hypothetical protein